MAIGGNPDTVCRQIEKWAASRVGFGALRSTPFGTDQSWGHADTGFSDGSAAIARPRSKASCRPSVRYSVACVPPRTFTHHSPPRFVISTPRARSSSMICMIWTRAIAPMRRSMLFPREGCCGTREALTLFALFSEQSPSRAIIVCADEGAAVSIQAGSPTIHGSGI
jgi:hypothetical protein